MSALLSSVTIAWRALRVNKLRSALTVLGIVIGVAAVIAMAAIGEGAEARIEEEIASLGSNVIVVQPGSIRVGGVRLGWGNASTLTHDDAAAIAEQVPTVVAAAPSIRGNAQVVRGNSNWYTRILGTTPEYLMVRNLQVARGSAFTYTDERGATKVALLGRTVVDQLFGTADPLDRTIRINRVPFTVIGTLAAKGQSPSGQDQDDTILIPLSTARRKVLGRSWANASGVATVHVLAGSGESTEIAERQVRELLRQRHDLGANEQDDFQVRNLTSRYRARMEAAEVTSLLLACIAGISLLVGGIGIMNIMLVSVTERTKEIGLRQAVGAKTRHIMAQFLAEAVTLSLAGGTLGILLGAVASVVVSRLMGWQILLSAEIIALAFFFAILVGIFFGYYPARKAALLNPIDAIRYE